MMKQTKFWVLLFAALAILGGGAFLLLRGHGQTGQTAVIRIDGEVYQRIDLRAALLRKPAPPALKILSGVSAVLKRRGDLHAPAEYALRERLHLAPLKAFLMRAEILEIPAVVENYKTALVRIFAVYLIDAAQPRAEPRAAPYHLPELRL